jgi:hypothetical protein
MLVDQDGQPRKARMLVSLGTGKAIRRKEFLLINPARQA